MADNLNTAAGCRLALGGKTGANTEADYKKDVFVEIGEIEDLGEFGDTFSSVTFTSLRDGRVRKYKGTADAGDLTMTVGLDNGDLGQKAVKTAHKDRSKGDYNIKVTLNDGDAAATPVAPGAADNVVRRNITMGINSDIIEIAAGPAA
jgi:hypothetical protein